MTYERQTWAKCGCSFCRGIRVIETATADVSEDPAKASDAPPEEEQHEALALASGEEAP